MNMLLCSVIKKVPSRVLNIIEVYFEKTFYAVVMSSYVQINVNHMLVFIPYFKQFKCLFKTINHSIKPTLCVQKVLHIIYIYVCIYTYMFV